MMKYLLTQLFPNWGQTMLTQDLKWVSSSPYALQLTTPRRVAIPLLPQVKAELKSTEAMEVMIIPTEWCAGMVVVPKSKDDVRIFVDLTQRNEMFAVSDILFQWLSRPLPSNPMHGAARCAGSTTRIGALGSAATRTFVASVLAPPHSVPLCPQARRDP